MWRDQPPPTFDPFYVGELVPRRPTDCITCERIGEGLPEPCQVCPDPYLIGWQQDSVTTLARVDDYHGTDQSWDIPAEYKYKGFGGFSHLRQSVKSRVIRGLLAQVNNATSWVPRGSNSILRAQRHHTCDEPKAVCRSALN